MPDIEIEGIAKLRRELKQIDPALLKRLRGSFLSIAQHVATDARGTVPRRSGQAAGSIRAGVSGNNVYVQGGKKAVPYYGWLDFGGGIPNKRNRRGKPPRISRPYLRKGRFLYPAIDRNKARVTNESVRAVNQSIREAFGK